MSETLGWLSYFAQLEGDTEEAAVHADRALEVARKVGDAHALLRALMVKANALNAEGKQDAALESYIEIAEQDVSIGHEASVSRIVSPVGVIVSPAARALSADQVSAMAPRRSFTPASAPSK